MNISDFNDWLISKEKKSLVMGILNVTPNSFSDGGIYFDTQKAINHALSMIEDGADIIDIGGESTRPFSDPVSVDDELSRVIPVIKGLRKKTDILISIDTTKSTVAREACSIGADIINDISGMLFDKKMIDKTEDIYPNNESNLSFSSELDILLIDSFHLMFGFIGQQGKSLISDGVKRKLKLAGRWDFKIFKGIMNLETDLELNGWFGREQAGFILPVEAVPASLNYNSLDFLLP